MSDEGLMKENDICHIVCRPRKGSILTDFTIKYKDIPALIKMLNRLCPDETHKDFEKQNIMITEVRLPLTEYSKELVEKERNHTT